MTTLSLVMIVQDGGDELPRLLATHKSLYDEAVVVDTGSRDDTPARAARAGARVIRHTWDDDFAAARNSGLDAARSDWILTLDADECIAPADFNPLRAALAGPPRVLVQPTINYCDDPRHPEWRPLSGRHPDQERGQTGWFLAHRAGLFPRRADLRFRGRVHESVMPAAQQAGLTDAPLDVPVHHYGYVQGRERNLRRRGLYAQLVRRKLVAFPDDDAALLEMATVHLEEGDAGAARPLLLRLAARESTTSTVTRARFLLGRLLREAGDSAAAADCLAEAVAADCRLLACWLEWIRALGDLERWAEADAAIRRARTVFPDDPLLDREELRGLIKTGRFAAAAANARRVASCHPGWPEIAQLAARLNAAAESSG
jgi:tetratricopeptide (TPR) repeat protein